MIRPNPKPRGSTFTPLCHPDRRGYAHGKCEPCYKRNLYHTNSETRAKSLASAAKRRAQDPLAWRRWQLRRDYGLDWNTYTAMVKTQNGVCAICQRKPTGRGFYVDHDHETGHVRGLLCSTCNIGLGVFRDDRALLFAAIHYIQDARARSQGAA